MTEAGTGAGQPQVTPDGQENDLARALSNAARILFSWSSTDEVLQGIVEVACEVIDGCDDAAITMIDGVDVFTPAATGERVRAIAELQAELREGPCLEVIRVGELVSAPDLLEERRWPRFAKRAADVGYRSIMAFRLFADGHTFGAVSVYATTPEAFGPDDVVRGTVLAAQAAMALTQAERVASREATAEGLQAALESRDVIGQAKGILMERGKITPDEAFDRLRRASQALNIKLRDVAQHVVDTGEDPEEMCR